MLHKAATAVMVGVAQLAERQVVVLDVVGSSPIVHPDATYADVATTPNPVALGSGCFAKGTRYAARAPAGGRGRRAITA
jgi:hypothetical protein